MVLWYNAFSRSANSYPSYTLLGAIVVGLLSLRCVELPPVFLPCCAEFVPFCWVLLRKYIFRCRADGGIYHGIARLFLIYLIIVISIYSRIQHALRLSRIPYWNVRRLPTMWDSYCAISRCRICVRLLAVNIYDSDTFVFGKVLFEAKIVKVFKISWPVEVEIFFDFPLFKTLVTVALRDCFQRRVAGRVRWWAAIWRVSVLLHHIQGGWEQSFGVFQPYQASLMGSTVVITEVSASWSFISGGLGRIISFTRLNSLHFLSNWRLFAYFCGVLCWYSRLFVEYWEWIHWDAARCAH